MKDKSSTLNAVRIKAIPDSPDSLDEMPLPDAGFSKFPNHLSQRIWKFGPGSALHVYMALLYYHRPGSFCYPSLERLSEMTGLAKRSITRGLRHLEKIGLLRTLKGNNTSNHYHLVDTLPPKGP
jgi:hypothetical protein